MKKLLLLWPIILFAREDFISHYEYGQMLYQNPRGISCVDCHGSRGEGKVIVTFGDRDDQKVLRGADIRAVSLANMIKSTNSYHKIMPRYYLTNDEIKAIYDYLQKRNRKRKN